MVFSSSIFLLYFLPIFLAAYHLLPSRQLKNYFILAASIFFYSWGAPRFIFVILASTIIDFYLVKALYNSSEQRRKKQLLFLSIFLNLGLLLYFKYANFFIDNLNGVLQGFGVEQIAWTRILLPIGISFYTFQTLTYSIDVYRGTSKPLKRVTDYLLYILSFPQMIAGPIVRFHDIAKQINERQEKIDDKLIGFYRFCIGLAKKVLLANVMGEQADLIFNQDYASLSFASAWLGVLAYTFQIYFDFSGYSDMAIGLGRMMGFRFPENFNAPYVSRSISEFWRRWHITLGDFMKDYLYIPLGGNRVKNKSRWYFNLWFVFLLSGLWHGASWNFVLWGVFHGCFLILDRIFLLNVLKKIGAFPAMLFTFFVTMLGWVIFRIEDLAQIKIFMARLFSFDRLQTTEMIPAFKTILVFAIIFSFLAALPFGKKVIRFFFEKESYSLLQNLLFAIVAVGLFILSICSITSSNFNPFIYFRF